MAPAANLPIVTQGYLGVNEFFNRAPQILNPGSGQQPTNVSFVQAAYKLLFGVLPTDAELLTPVTNLNNKTTTTMAVALALATSPRYLFGRSTTPTDLDVVNGMVTAGFVAKTYLRFLGRLPTYAEVTFWRSHYTTDANLIAYVLADPTYFGATHPYP
jgi:hypothetical protein